MTAAASMAASTAVCTHGRTRTTAVSGYCSRSTRVQQAVQLLVYTKKYGRTYAVCTKFSICISYDGLVYTRVCTPCS